VKARPNVFGRQQLLPEGLKIHIGLLGLGKHATGLRTAGVLEFREPLLDLTVIRLEKGNCIGLFWSRFGR
jgi:hypothetical protein